MLQLKCLALGTADAINCSMALKSASCQPASGSNHGLKIQQFVATPVAVACAWSCNLCAQDIRPSKRANDTSVMYASNIKLLLTHPVSSMFWRCYPLLLKEIMTHSHHFLCYSCLPYYSSWFTSFLTELLLQHPLFATSRKVYSHRGIQPAGSVPATGLRPLSQTP